MPSDQDRGDANRLRRLRRLRGWRGLHPRQKRAAPTDTEYRPPPPLMTPVQDAIDLLPPPDPTLSAARRYELARRQAMEYPNRHWVEHIRGPSWRPLGRTPAEEPPILMRLTTFSRIVYPSSSTTTTTSSMSSSARPVGRTRNRHQNAIPDPRAHFVPLRAYLVNSVASPTQKSANPNHTPLVSQPNLSVRIRPAKTSRKRARDPTPLPSSSSSARNNDNPWFPANKRQRSSTLAEIVSAHQDDVNRVQAAAALLGLRTEELVEKQKLAGKKYATRSADAAASTAYNPPTTQQQQQRSSPNKSKPLRRSSRLSKRS